MISNEAALDTEQHVIRMKAGSLYDVIRLVDYQRIPSLSGERYDTAIHLAKHGVRCGDVGSFPHQPDKTFLFAADMSPDLSLIHYYEQALRFMQDASIGANKPAYDFCCSFMCQPLRELAKNRKNYFEHFNDKVM